MADNKTSWVFDLDLKDATEQIIKFQGSVDKVGSQDNLKGLISGLTEVGAVVGILGATFFALKTTMDTVFDAENIKAVNEQFNIMTKNAGIATETLREGLEKSAHGLIDDTELLKIANQAIAKMGDNASRLPEIMDLARKAAAVFGGTIQENFQGLSTAVANGNARMLKQYGIIIDNDTALRKYAASLGTTVDQLSESGKQAAIMNAAIEKGAKAFAGVNENIKENQNLWQQMKVLIAEIGETFTMVFGTTLAPLLSKFFTTLKEGLTSANETLTAFYGKWGENAKVADAQANVLTKTLKGQQDQMEMMKAAQAGANNMYSGLNYEKLIKDQEQKILITESEINGLRAKKEQIEETNKAEKEAASEGGGASPKTDLNKTNQHNADFLKSLEAMKAKTLELEEQNATDIETVDKLHAERKIEIERQAEAAIAEIKAKVGRGELSGSEANQLEIQVEQQKNQKILSLDDQLEQKRIAALERYAERNKFVAQGFSAAWAAETKKAENNSKNFALLGQKSFSSLKTHATDAFKAIGNGSKDMASAMKDAILSTLGDIATAEGEELLAEGLGRAFLGDAGGVGAAAEGGALIALGSAMGSSGGSSGPSSGSGADLSGGGSYGGSTQTGVPASPAASPENKKSVTVQVQGNYFETEETKAKLIDIIKSANDASDYSFKQIGQ